MGVSCYENWIFPTLGPFARDFSVKKRDIRPLLHDSSNLKYVTHIVLPYTTT